jgi:Asp-tRNA(Asn)/Glu-tRNA(Gln) amidotransferase A subunit family amidase
VAADGAVPLTAVERVRALLARVDAVEPQVQAWVVLDRAALLREAEAADAAPPAGPLHGVPVGLKDIIATADLPTQNGTVLHAGRQPAVDALLVQRLKRAGALLMGKTVTTELATYAPGPTRNPHNPAHTPGGSSSGSAAAVAAGMVPLAVGTQTNGSVLRPASFCGVVGFKPSAGRIPREGVLEQSPSFDCVGVFAHSVEEVALLAAVLADEAVPDLPALSPALAWCDGPVWDRVTPDAQAAYRAWQQAQGLRAVALPAGSDMAVEQHRVVMEAEIAQAFQALDRTRLSASLQGQIERGLRTASAQLQEGREAALALRAAFTTWFDTQGLDALAMPSALGTAPEGLASTGDPVMCTLASFAGLPAISLPLLAGANGLPLGVQLIGRFGDDTRLLRAAAALLSQAR